MFQGRPDLRMPELFHDDAGMGSLGKLKRREAVAQVVEALCPKLCSLNQSREEASDISGVQRASVSRREHVSAVHPVRART